MSVMASQNHQHLDYLLNHLFMCRSKKTSNLRVTGLCVGNSPVTGEFPAQWPVTRKMFQFDDVIMQDKVITPVLYYYPLMPRVIYIDIMCHHFGMHLVSIYAGSMIYEIPSTINQFVAFVSVFQVFFWSYQRCNASILVPYQPLDITHAIYRYHTCYLCICGAPIMIMAITPEVNKMPLISHTICYPVLGIFRQTLSYNLYLAMPLSII